MKKLLKAAGVVGLALNLACAKPPDTAVEMTFKATNSADQILVIEGQTDLPGGAPLRAELQDRDGRVVMRDSCVVRRGSFYFDFGLDSLVGLSLYKVVVTFNPEEAPLGVRRVTGLFGESLVGEGIREEGDFRIFRRSLDVVLSADSKGQDWEGRNFEKMEVSERAKIVSGLEKYVDKVPTDRSAKLALARAYIAIDSRELGEGSRAHQLLIDVTRTPKSDRETRAANALLSEIKKKESAKLAKDKKRKKMMKGDSYRTKTQIVPGQALGGFRLGTPYKVIARYFKVDSVPDWKTLDDNAVVTLREFPDLELTYGRSSRKLVKARTTSPRFHLPEGHRVGSPLADLQSEYGKRAVPTPKQWKPLPVGSNGHKRYVGVSRSSGLEFEILRDVEPQFGMTSDKIRAITVRD